MLTPTRRDLLKSGVAVLIGFDTAARRWVTPAEAVGPFDAVPPLDGTLHRDIATRAADSEDLGHIVRRTPAAVLRPGSVRDIQVMVRFCRERGIPVAPRGQHHTTHGQGLTRGLVIETGTLNRIHAIEADRAEVDAGITWSKLFETTLARGLTAPVHTGYIQLSVGGTLSVGGLGTAPGEGLQVDRVLELEVVDGTGALLRCSPAKRPDLFAAALGGLGQCAIITRAVLELVPAPSMVRTWVLPRVEPRSFFRDMRTLLDRGELRDVWCEFMPPGSAATYGLQAAIPYEPGAEPDGEYLLRGLSLPAVTALPLDRSYHDFITRVDVQIQALQVAFGWDDLIKPWFDVWLPDDAVEGYVTDVVSQLTPLDIGPGLCLLFAMRRDTLTRPAVRVPQRGRYVWLFDILNASLRPGPDPVFVQTMLARNRRLYDRAASLGGTRYPIGTVEFARADWRTHYGEYWTAFKQAKRRHDPCKILTPGPGIFA